MKTYRISFKTYFVIAGFNDIEPFLHEVRGIEYDIEEVDYGVVFYAWHISKDSPIPTYFESRPNKNPEFFYFDLINVLRSQPVRTCDETWLNIEFSAIEYTDEFIIDLPNVEIEFHFTKNGKLNYIINNKL
jgi:hypothetical protein